MGFSTTVPLPIHPDRIIPDRYRNPISECDTSIRTPGYCVKTHDCFFTSMGLISKNAFNNVRHIYIYRNPEDSLVSFYHFHKRDHSLSAETKDGIDAFCLKRLKDWNTNIESYIRGKEAYSEKIFFLSYEKMLSEPFKILKDIFFWIAFPIKDVFIQNSILNMQFDNLRSMEEKKPKSNLGFFFRKGISGSGAQELKPSTRDYIYNETRANLQQANAFLNSQGSCPFKEVL
jgi:hypothetical protein